MQYGNFWQTGGALVVLVMITAIVMSVSGIRLRKDMLGAMVRAIVQLAIVALLIAWVFLHPEGAYVYLAIMLVAATATSLRRVKCGWHQSLRLMIPIAIGTVAGVTPVFAFGALQLHTQTALPFTAQVLGGSMTAVSVAGTRFRDGVYEQWDAVEGALSLGFLPHQAVRHIGIRAAELSLIPGLDQTRSAGLVVLPGAFVGMLIGGASALEAAQVQLLVLAALVAATAAASASAVWALATEYGRTRPAHPY